MDKKRILIVGGVAGGASCAARARRLCEKCEIIVFDRGKYVSFANCGLPYYVGDVITEEQDLIVATPQLFKERFNVQVCTETEVLCIDREKKQIEVKDLNTGQRRYERYDALVLSPGARAIRPPVPGVDLPGIHVIRTIPDSRKIKGELSHVKTAVVVGAGFIGLEMAENLARLGIKVSIVEMSSQVMPPLDAEMAHFVEHRLREEKVALYLGEGIAGFEKNAVGGLIAISSAGSRIEADIVILAIGIKPEIQLAVDSGLAVGERGGIRVDERMRTNDPHIWAIGDAVETVDHVTKTWQLIPLAGPANRQGRIAAASVVSQLYDNACVAGKSAKFRGVQGTAVCGVFEVTIVMTGASEKALIRAGVINYEKIYLHPGNHVSYYPGAQAIHMKIVFDKTSGRILGAQGFGGHGVARRIDVIAMAMQLGGTVYDLEEAELCYAPQYGAAKDPVNIAGMIAANYLRGDLPLARWEELQTSGAQIIDVRDVDEFALGHLQNAVNIPLEQLRQRMNELPKERELWLVCAAGQRAYYAVRTLLQAGYKVKNLSGGMQISGGFLKDIPRKTQ